MKKTTYLTIIAMSLSGLIKAQDVHYSFAELSPLSINPALAGANADKEIILNYRNQWSRVGTPYTTQNAAFHGRLSNTKKKQDNWICAGLQLTSDKAGAPGVTNNGVSLSLADQIKVSRNSRLGLGLQVGFAQRSIRPADGRWGSQYDGTAYNAAVQSGEDATNISKSYADVGVGALYSYAKRKGSISGSIDHLVNIGFSAYHVTRPDYGFVNSEDAKLPIRYTFFANGEFAVRDGAAALMPGAYVFRQGTFSEYLLGLYYKYKVINPSKYTGYVKPLSVSFGVFARANDAAILKLLVDYHRYSIGYSFDANTSKLSTYINSRGAHELVLRFVIY